MRYKTTSLVVAILLISTPVFAQEAFPIVIETLRTTNPTTVITNQPFTQTYVVKFIDFAEEGQEIIVQEDALNAGIFGNFEVLDLKIAKITPPRKQFLEHWWYLNYTLRIINQEKGPYVIPSITVPWVLKQIGQEMSDPSLKVINSDLKTDEVHINYVTTIPEKETFLDIRDEINFGRFSFRARLFRAFSWTFGTLPLLIFVLVLFRNLKSTKKSQEKEPSIHTLELDDTDISTWKVISRKEALRNLKSGLKEFRQISTTSSREDFFKIEAGLSKALNDFLRAEFCLSPGSTPSDILLHVNKKQQDSRYKNLLLVIAMIAVFYYQDVERGSSSVDFSDQTKNLIKTLKGLHWYSRFFDFLRKRQ